MNNGFFRVAAVSPVVTLADPKSNVRRMAELAAELSQKNVQLAVFPELSVTGYTCADLFHNRGLLDAAEDAVREYLMLTAGLSVVTVIGAPVAMGNALYNCALFVSNGCISAIVPKTYLPSYNEFYERRWWQPAPAKMATASYAGCHDVPFGTKQLVNIDEVNVSAEICEDLWTPVPPSSQATMAGADVVVNLSASDALIGKYAYLKSLVNQQSARCLCAYVYAGAGWGESSTDLVFDGIAMVSECGTMLAEADRWSTKDTYVITDVDIMAVRRDRMHTNSYNDCSLHFDCQNWPIVYVPINVVYDDKLMRNVNPDPFVPSDTNHLDERCTEIVNIQTTGLMRRLDFTHCKSLVVGISGGLDSTLALLVAVRAFDRLGLDRKGILGVTMPGFGTTGRTHDNAVALMEKLGVSMREISIVPAVNQHFKDIEHNPENHDITYENAQARQRTYLLMDIANQTCGMVLGTGDLSELALGWATYNGDHMSMYGVNAGVPKTLVRHLVCWFAATDNTLTDLLMDIAETPISPELLPADKDGNIAQKTEDNVGPYRLHDFFLYYTLRYGFDTARIELLARNAFKGIYDDITIKHWLTTFTRRFFAQQFKRSCLPDGPKVGSVCLSPRGDWRMPSDAPSTAWLSQLR